MKIRFYLPALFAAAITLGGAVVCVAQNAGNSAGAGPRIEFSGLFFDFGRVAAGREVSHDFIFTNTGDQLLEISDVQSSCGCTTATNWAKQIEPGKSGVIPVLFNSGGMAGPLTKNLWVVCNDTNQSPVTLRFSAMVWKLIDAIPTVAAFTFGPDFQTNQMRTIHLVSNLDEPVTLSSPVCTNREFEAELNTVLEGKEYVLTVTVVPPLAPGSLAVPITMKTSSPKMPEVVVTAYAMVQPTLTVTPSRILVSDTPLESVGKYIIKIQNNGTRPVALSEPIINVKGADVQLGVIEPARIFALTVTLPAGFKFESGKTVVVTVKSDCQQSPIIKVPVLQRESLTLD
jgi:hypothetical protein